jgi:hypothetical protein
MFHEISYLQSFASFDFHISFTSQTIKAVNPIAENISTRVNKSVFPVLEFSAEIFQEISSLHCRVVAGRRTARDELELRKLETLRDLKWNFLIRMCRLESLKLLTKPIRPTPRRRSSKLDQRTYELRAVDEVQKYHH